MPRRLSRWNHCHTSEQVFLSFLPAWRVWPWTDSAFRRAAISTRPWTNCRSCWRPSKNRCRQNRCRLQWFFVTSSSFDFSSFRKVDLKFSELFSREIFRLQGLEIKIFILRFCNKCIGAKNKRLIMKLADRSSYHKLVQLPLSKNYSFKEATKVSAA